MAANNNDYIFMPSHFDVISQDIIDLALTEETKLEEFAHINPYPAFAINDMDAAKSTVLDLRKLELSSRQDRNDRKRKIQEDSYNYTPEAGFEYESKVEDARDEVPVLQVSSRCATRSRRLGNKPRSISFDEAKESRRVSPAVGRRNKRPRSNSDSEVRTRAPLWTEQEEVFLVGSVMKRFFQYGSLASSRKTENDVWDSIKLSFDHMVKDHGREGQPVRSKNALSRHFKFMKSTQDPSRPKFYHLYKKYEERYGKGSMFEGLLS